MWTPHPQSIAAVILPIVVTFVHLDPRFTVTAADGTVISTTVDENAPSGWSFQPYGSGSSSASSDGERVTCNSNTLGECLVDRVVAGADRWCSQTLATK